MTVASHSARFALSRSRLARAPSTFCYIAFNGSAFGNNAIVTPRGYVCGFGFGFLDFVIRPARAKRSCRNTAKNKLAKSDRQLSQPLNHAADQNKPPAMPLFGGDSAVSTP